MPYALLNTSGDKDYHTAVVRFLEDIEDEEVDAVVLIGMTKKGPFLHWLASQRDLGAAAAALQAQFTLNYTRSEDDEDCD